MSENVPNASEFLDEINDKVIKGIEQNKPIKIMPSDFLEIINIIQSINLFNVNLLLALYKKNLINEQEKDELRSIRNSTDKSLDELIISVMGSYAENVDE